MCVTSKRAAHSTFLYAPATFAARDDDPSRVEFGIVESAVRTRLAELAHAASVGSTRADVGGNLAASLSLALCGECTRTCCVHCDVLRLTPCDATRFQWRIASLASAAAVNGERAFSSFTRRPTLARTMLRR